MDTTNGADGNQAGPDDAARSNHDAAQPTGEAMTPAEQTYYPQTAPTEPVVPTDAAAPAGYPAEQYPGQYSQPYSAQQYPAQYGQPYPGQPYPGQYGQQGQHYAQQYPGQSYAQQYMWAPLPAAPDPRKRRRRSIALACGAFATAALFGIGTSVGIAGATGAFGQLGSSNSSAAQPAENGAGGSGTGSAGGLGTGGSGGGSGTGGSYGFGGSAGGSSGSGSASLPSASAAQEVGVVDIVSQLTYDSAESAGTGLVLTSSGEILTNNHVVEGSTSIKVTVVSTGKTYTATVVGTDQTDDVAVLKLSGVSGLNTANINSSANVSVGDSVTGVGNAGGKGGTQSASAGKVTATNQSITTQAEESAVSESLSGLIQTDADIQAGDSGGPLYNASNQVVGIDTAASSGTSDVEGYAIPIGNALTIAKQIESGDASDTVAIGYPAFLGIEVDASGDPSDGGAGGGSAGGFGAGGFGAGGFGSDGQSGGETTSGATVGQVIADTPADSAGLVAGDVITGVNGTTISSSSDLTAALKNYKPGQTVTITWVDASGASQSASVTLTTGPVA